MADDYDVVGDGAIGEKGLLCSAFSWACSNTQPEPSFAQKLGVNVNRDITEVTQAKGMTQVPRLNENILGIRG